MSPAPKADPQALSQGLPIRAARPAPKRLSRKALMTGTAVMGGAIAIALLLGLSPRSRTAAAQTEETVPVAATLPEGISALPARYGEAMLPGEAAPAEPRKMLWDERAPPEGYDAYAPEDSPVENRQEDFGWSGSPPPNAPAQIQTAGAAAKETPVVAPLFFEPRRMPDRAPAFSSRRDRFPAGYDPTVANDVRVSPAEARADMTPSASPYMLQAGTVIPAALMTAVNSDLPGRVIAQVTAPVYDSVSGDHLLIPQGTRLIGTYSSENRYGDTRVSLAWNRMILPSGWSVDLGKMEATDSSGASGLPARVDNHLDRISGAIAVSAVLSILANEAEDDDDDEDGFGRSLGDAAAQEAARTGSRIVDRELNLRPTLKAKPGAPVRVLVTEDLTLEPYVP